MKQQYVPLDKRSKRKKAGRWKDYDPSTGFFTIVLLTLTEWISLIFGSIAVYSLGGRGINEIELSLGIFIMHIMYYIIVYKWRKIKMLIEPIIAMGIWSLIGLLLHSLKDIGSPGILSFDIGKGIMVSFFYSAIVYSIFALIIWTYSKIKYASKTP